MWYWLVWLVLNSFLLISSGQGQSDADFKDSTEKSPKTKSASQILVVLSPERSSNPWAFTFESNSESPLDPSQQRSAIFEGYHHGVQVTTMEMQTLPPIVQRVNGVVWQMWAALAAVPGLILQLCGIKELYMDSTYAMEQSRRNLWPILGMVMGLMGTFWITKSTEEKESKAWTKRKGRYMAERQRRREGQGRIAWTILLLNVVTTNATLAVREYDYYGCSGGQRHYHAIAYGRDDQAKTNGKAPQAESLEHQSRIIQGHGNIGCSVLGEGGDKGVQTVSLCLGTSSETDGLLEPKLENVSRIMDCLRGEAHIPVGQPCFPVRTRRERLHQAESRRCCQDGRPTSTDQGGTYPSHRIEGRAFGAPSLRRGNPGQRNDRAYSPTQEIARVNGDNDVPDEVLPGRGKSKETQEGRLARCHRPRKRKGEGKFDLGLLGQLPNGIRGRPATSHSKKVTWADGCDFQTATERVCYNDFEQAWMSWSHSVTSEDDYKSPWMARTQAMLLQADVQQGLFECVFDETLQAFRIHIPCYRKGKGDFRSKNSEREIELDAHLPSQPRLLDEGQIPKQWWTHSSTYAQNDDLTFNSNWTKAASNSPNHKRRRIDEMNVEDDHPLEPWYVTLEEAAPLILRQALRAHLSFETIHALQGLQQQREQGQTINTYGLLTVCQGKRTTRVESLEPNQLTTAIQQLWSDYAGYEADIYLVQPQPYDHQDYTFLVVFDAVNTPFDRAVPVLQQLLWEDYNEQVMRYETRANYLQDGTHYLQICGMVRIMDQCLNNDCTILIGSRPVTYHVWANIHRGDLAQIFIPPQRHHLQPENLVNIRTFEETWNSLQQRVPRVEVEVGVHAMSRHGEINACFLTNVQRFCDHQVLCRNIQSYLSGRDFRQARVYCVHLEFYQAPRVYVQVEFVVTFDNPVESESVLVVAVRDPLGTQEVLLTQHPSRTTGNQILQRAGVRLVNDAEVLAHGLRFNMDDTIDLQIADYVVINSQPPQTDGQGSDEPMDATSMIQIKEPYRLIPPTQKKTQGQLLLESLWNEEFELIWHFPWNGSFPRSRAMISLLESWTDDWTVRCHHIYTDGSAGKSRQSSTWAFTVILESTDLHGGTHFSYGGSAGGHHLISKSSNFIGGASHHPIEAETSALYWACVWVLHQQIDSGVTFHSDALAALHGMIGTWRTPSMKSGSDSLFMTARHLFKYVQQKVSMVRGEHVKSHVGFPGNESADEIANAIRQGVLHSTDLPPTGQEFAFASELRFFWMQGKISAEYPEIEDDHIVPAPFKQNADLMPLKGYFPDVKPGQCRSVGCQLRLATINTLTLLETEGMSFFDKRLWYQHQAVDRKWHLIGLQETRARQSRLITNDAFYILQCEAQSGHGGLELWIARKIDGLDVHPKDFQVVVQQPRFFGVCLRTSFLTLDVYVIHVPPERGSEQAHSFWRELAQAIGKRRHLGIPLCILGDCNSHLEQCEPHIGHKDPEKMCQNGNALLALMQEEELHVPSTFAEIHEGKSYTCLAKGHRHRIDYVLLPISWHDMIQKSYVDFTFDMNNQREDHHPLVVEMNCALILQRPPVRRQAKYDRIAASKPAARPQLQKIWSDMPEIPWTIPMDDHVALVDDYCLRALQQAFPCPKRPPRQPYFDHSDLQLIDDRRILLHTKKEATDALRVGHLRLLFHLWRNTATKDDFFLLHVTSLHCAMVTEQYDAVNLRYRQVRASRRKDYTHRIVAEFQEAHANKDIKWLHKALKPLRPQSQKHRIKVPMPLPGLCDGEGNALDSQAAIAKQWEDAWGALELAESVEPLAMIPEEQQYRNLDLKMSPGLLELEGAFRRVRPHKAAGLDGVGPELYRADPALAALRLLPLILKEFSCQQVPVRHQGGLAVAIFKKGSYLDCQNYRSILLEPILGKCMAKTWRHRLTAALDNIALPMQHGARSGPGVLQNIHALRLRIRLAKAKGKTSVILFLDLKSAFYAAMRALLLESDCDEAFTQKVFRVFGLPPTAFDDFTDTMASSKALDEAGLPEPYIKMVQATFAKSWFKVDSGSRVQQTYAGTRPRDPSADVLFALTMAKCLQNIVKEVTESLPTVDIFTPLTYVDDVAIHAATDAPEALRILATISQKVYDVMVRHGMRPNLGPGKTEGMISYAGKGSRQIRREIEKGEQPMLPFVTTHAGPQALRITKSYKYLGALIEDNENLIPEIRSRTLQAQGQMRPLKKHILANPLVASQAKRTIMQSLGISKASYAIGTWPGLTVTQRTLWQNGILELYRMLQPIQKEKTTVAETLRHAELPTPQNLLRRHRFIVTSQLGQHGSADYKTLILQEATTGPRSFLEVVRSDWIWYNEYISHPETTPLPTTATHEEMIDYISTQDGRRHIFQLMKNAFKCHALQLEALCAARGLYEGIERHLMTGASIPQEPSTFRCPTCQMTFRTNTALSVHQRLKHKAVALARSYAWSSQCLWCHREYHTRPRAITHLQYSGTACLSNLVQHYEPMSEVQRMVLDTEDRIQKQQAKKSGRPSLPMRRVFLPAPPVSLPEEEEQQTPGGTPQPQELVEEGPDDPDDPLQRSPPIQGPDPVESILEQLWDLTIEAWHTSADAGYKATTSFFKGVDFESLNDTQYRHLENEFVDGLQELSDICNDPDIYLRLEQYTDRWFPVRPRVRLPLPGNTVTHIHPGRFQPSERYKIPQADTSAEDWYGIAVELENKIESHLWKSPAFVPKPLATGELFVLLPFGGTRRYGDIPMWLDWGNGASSHTLRGIVLDLGISASGDMLDAKKIAQWKALMWEGKVCYLHSAPPCETWSAARWLPPPLGSHKPRPLRAEENPWMVKGRDPREIRQTITGTKLMAATLELSVWAYTIGLPVSVEHPSTWDGRASIWSTRAIKTLMTLPRLHLYKFQQSSFGQCSLKPTTFLLGNNQILAKMMTAHIKANRTKPETLEVLKGLDAADPTAWSTAKAKTYPPELCRILARAAQYSARHSPSAPDVPLSEAVKADLAELCQAFDPYSWSEGYAPDYHR